MIDYSPNARPALAALVAMLLMASALYVLRPAPEPILSRWTAGPVGAAPIQAGFSGVAQPRAPGGLEQLAHYNTGSVLQEAVADGRVSFYRRAVGAGEIAYVVAHLDPNVQLEVVGANGARPSSDASGDTVWADGGKHLATVQAIVTAPYAQRQGLELLGAINFGFHGARTSNEGSVVVHGEVLRVNAGRAALCIAEGGVARIGLYDHAALARCQQAIGGGPVTLLSGKVVDPGIGTETNDKLPFNPLGEDFAQLDWRRMIYSGDYPKTMVGIGARPDGRSYLVLLVSRGLDGVTVAEQLRAMGCSDALGGDDDTSTQGVWRGVPVWNNHVRPVPDALAVYMRQ